MITQCIVFSSLFTQIFHSADTKELQLTSMRLAIGQLNGFDSNFRNLYFASDSIEGDPCTWRGVGCDAGALTSLAWVQASSFRTVFVEWLPNTLQRLHLKNLRLGEGLSTRKLPKSLKYAFFASAAARGACNGFDGRLDFEKLDFSALPSCMEELHFVTCTLGGTVTITELPQDMRILSLFNCCVEKVRIFNEGLPRSLQSIRVSDYYTTPKFVPMGAKNLDTRVTFIADFSGSKYFNAMNAIVRQLESIIFV